MKTKVILHGGNSSRKSEKNDRFFYEIINSVSSDTVNILCIYFARPEHRWEDSYAEDQSEFFSLETFKEINIKMATYDTEELLEKISGADVIFINGGMRGHLKETLLKLGDLNELFAGKTVVGISSGANILSAYYYSSVGECIREGTGYLPIKIFTHFDASKMEELKELHSYGKDLPIVKIAEERYVVMDLGKP